MIDLLIDVAGLWLVGWLVDRLIGWLMLQDYDWLMLQDCGHDGDDMLATVIAAPVEYS